MLQNDPRDQLSISDLVEIAKSDEPVAPDAKVEKRVLKDIETFIAEYDLKPGKKLVHNIILYALYKQNPTNTLSRSEFINGMEFFFPRHFNTQKNLCFKLSPKLSNKRKLDLTPTHLKNCRALYGAKKQKDQKVEDSISGSGEINEQS